MTTTQILVDLARTARSCAEHAQCPNRKQAYEALADSTRLHAERWALGHPDEIGPFKRGEEVGEGKVRP